MKANNAMSLSNISIGSFTISTYWIMVGVGAMGMLVYTLKRRKLLNITATQCLAFSLLLTLCGISGAKLLYSLEHMQEPIIETLLSGGVSFFGAAFLIPLLMPISGRAFRLNNSQVLDLCAPCVAIMIGVIRIGCFFNGCCGGRIAWIGDYSFVWPTQAIESIGDFVIFTRLHQYSDNDTHQGLLYPTFLIYYGILRFFVEFLRDTIHDWLCLSHGQWFSAAALLVGITWLLVHKNRRLSTCT